MKTVFATLLATATLLTAAATNAGAISLCFVDGDGAEWNLELNNDNRITGTVQIPVPQCVPGAVLGNWAFGDNAYEMHWLVREDLESCTPLATFAGNYRLLGGPGEAQVISLGSVKDMPLLPCESGTEAAGEHLAATLWWAE